MLCSFIIEDTNRFPIILKTGQLILYFVVKWLLEIFTSSTEENDEKLKLNNIYVYSSLYNKNTKIKNGR